MAEIDRIERELREAVAINWTGPVQISLQSVENIRLLLDELARRSEVIERAKGLSDQIEAAREFVKRHPKLSLIDLAEFEAFLKVPAAMDAVLARALLQGESNG
jgi:hypothetical protein